MAIVHRFSVAWVLVQSVLFFAAIPELWAQSDTLLRAVPFTDVTLTDGMWGSRIRTNRDVTIEYVFRKCEETSRIDNFAIAGGLKEGGFEGIFFNDSDVFKAIEGAAYGYAQSPDPRLDRYLDELIAKIAAAQEDDGYLYTARTIGDPDYDYPGREARWSHLASGHELYNVGHLYEAAVAHWQATGKDSLFQVAKKSADLVCREFGPGPGQRVDVPGHEEIEIGLVRMYRATGDEKYLRQAKFFVDMRGRSDLRKTYGPYCQDHVPVIQQAEPVGHAVRAGYLYAGVADVAALTGDQQYLVALERIWQNIVSKKLYLTGGIGASRSGEAFGANYELPNETAYNETCAAIALALFNQRMFLLHGDAKYADVLERILYNGFLAGVSLQGDTFFYPNPLACNGHTAFNQGVLGRSPWFGCSCCPVNVVRFVPSIAGYVYATRDSAAYVNLYTSGVGTVNVSGVPVTIQQQTDYPWNGDVKITLSLSNPAEFSLNLRIPGWVVGNPVPSDLYRYENAVNGKYTLRVNGEVLKQPAELENGYAVVRRQWRDGDTIELSLPMQVNVVKSHEAVEANRGRVAIERGPIVYCLEATDNGGSVYDIVLPPETQFTAEFRPDLLGGVTVLNATAQRVVADEDGTTSTVSTPVTAIPYFAWAHRQLGEMAVWVARDATVARGKKSPTIASAATPTASHVWGLDSVLALNDQIDPASSNDHGVPRHTWWDHRGTTEWVQYEFDRPTEIKEVSVYWFDDTGNGQCRLPKKWEVMVRDGDQWHPVENLTAYEIAKDSFNRVQFHPVKTTAVKLQVELQPDFSGGVLEWRVE